MTFALLVEVWGPSFFPAFPLLILLPDNLSFARPVWSPDLRPLGFRAPVLFCFVVLSASALPGTAVPFPVHPTPRPPAVSVYCFKPRKSGSFSSLLLSPSEISQTYLRNALFREYL